MLFNTFVFNVLKVYDSKLGKKSGLYVLKKGRKHAEEIKTSKDLIRWIKKQGVVRSDGVDDNLDAGDGYNVVEICIGFGAVVEDIHNVDIFFEKDSYDDESTVLETVLPSAEYDKKRDSRVTKTFPAELRSHFLRLYNDKASPIQHGFTFEMQQAAFQMLCLEGNSLTLESASAYYSFPPSEFF